MTRLDDFLEVLFPPSCSGCGQVLPRAGCFCADCESTLERTPTEHCTHCAEPGRFTDARCDRCQARPPLFTRAWSPFSHQGAIARAIHRFKYEDHPELAPVLGKLLADEAAAFLTAAPAEVCAVPLHPQRYRERRYDQAQLLAAEVAKRTGRRCSPQLLVREKITRRQVGLSEGEREANMAGAFSARGKPEGRRLLLIDDVFTTGATANAAAEALLDAGALEIQVLTLARADRVG